MISPTANFVGPTFDQRGSCRLHVGPTWARRALLSGTGPWDGRKWLMFRVWLVISLHDDVMTWELFCLIGPLWGQSACPCESLPSKCVACVRCCQPPKYIWIKTIWCSCDVTAIAHITDRYKPNWLFLVMNNWNCSVIQNIDLFWMTDMLLITLIYTIRWIKMILIYFKKSLKFVTSLQHVNIAFSNNLTLSISIFSCHTFPLNSCIWRWVTVNSLWPSMARYLKCCSNFQWIYLGLIIGINWY